MRSGRRQGISTRAYIAPLNPSTETPNCFDSVVVLVAKQHLPQHPGTASAALLGCALQHMPFALRLTACQPCKRIDLFRQDGKQIVEGYDAYEIARIVHDRRAAHGSCAHALDGFGNLARLANHEWAGGHHVGNVQGKKPPLNAQPGHTRYRDRSRSRRASSNHPQVLRLATVGEMAAGIAHELNQPLAAITNYAHACERLLGKFARRS